MLKTTRIAVLVSGGGTNLQALLDAQGRGGLSDGEIAVVISSKPGVYALERAGKAGVEALTVARKDYPDAESFCRALLETLETRGIDLVVLAGFLSILTPEFVRTYENRIINVHPELIPSFCGKGAYGLHVHEMALEYGVKVTGATIHFVTEGADEGPIILQKAVDILPGDTPESIQRRVMEEAEWKLLPKAVALFCEGKLAVEGRKVIIKEEQ